MRLHGATTRTVEITNSWVPGIDAELARIGGELDLRRSAIEGGSLILVNARIAGNVLLSDARISGPEEWALRAGGLVLEGGFFGQRLTSRGGLRLPGAQLLSGLFLHDARLENTGEVALAAGGVAAPTVDCSQGFTAHGGVRLRRARIEGLLTFEEAHLNGDGVALDCVGMQAGEFVYQTATPPSGPVDLRSAQVTWCQDSEQSWPEKVLLEGFTYGSLRFGDTPAASGDDGRLSGDCLLYTSLLLAKQRHRRQTRPPAARVWGHLLDVTVGYGYRPWLAGVWLVVLTLLGTLAFSTHTPNPVKQGEGGPFQPLVYTLDLLIPIGGLGQRTGWYWSNGSLQGLAYLLIAFGWVLTTAVIAGVTRTLQKN